MQDPLVAYVVRVARANWRAVSARSLNAHSAIQGIVDMMGSLKGTRMLLLASGGFLSDNLVTKPPTKGS